MPDPVAPANSQRDADEAWFRHRNDHPEKYQGRIDPNATSETIRQRYNRGRYWIITTD
jgi:hypothetical protein